MFNSLNLWLQPLFMSEIYNRLVAKMMYLNVVALLPQLWASLTADSVAGISAGMFGLFAFIQFVFLLESIRAKLIDLFWSMVFTLPQSLAIIVAVWVRG